MALWLSLLVLAMAGSGPGAKVQLPSPSVLLARAQTHYEKVHTLSAHFEQQTRIASLGRDEVSTGRVWVSRPGRMRWQYQSPQESILLVDGETLRLWMPGEKRLQIAPIDVKARAPTALGFLLGDERLDGSFRVSRVSVPGAAELRLLLEPREDAGFASLELRLDAATGVLRGSVLEDLFGNRTELRFSEVVENEPLPEETFTLKVPEDTEIIDLR